MAQLIRIALISAVMVNAARAQECLPVMETGEAAEAVTRTLEAALPNASVVGLRIYRDTPERIVAGFHFRRGRHIFEGGLAVLEPRGDQWHATRPLLDTDTMVLQEGAARALEREGHSLVRIERRVGHESGTIVEALTERCTPVVFLVQGGLAHPFGRSMQEVDAMVDEARRAAYERFAQARNGVIVAEVPHMVGRVLAYRNAHGLAASSVRLERTGPATSASGWRVVEVGASALVTEIVRLLLNRLPEGMTIRSPRKDGRLVVHDDALGFEVTRHERRWRARLRRVDGDWRITSLTEL